MRIARLMMLCGVAFLLLAAPARSATTSETPVVVSMRVSGVVDPFEANYIDDGIQAAESEHAAAVLITIDTPGGLDSSMRHICQSILNSSVPVITYVSPQGARAASAGTFILLSGSVAAMAPGTNTGAAHPVGVSGAIEESKVTNDAVAFIRSIAQLRGRNADWAEQAVRDSISISAEQAVTLQPPVVDLIAPDVPTLLSDLDGRSVPVAGGTVTLHLTGATLQPRGLGLGAAILHALFTPDLAFLFFYLGLGLIVLGFLHHPISAILGVLLLAASFVSFGELPFQIIGIALLVASVVFFLIELKYPGLGLPTVGGVVTLVLGGTLLFNSSVPNARVSWWVIGPVAIGMVLFFGIVVKKVLEARRQAPSMRVENLVGKEGVVTTALTPRGVVHIASERWTADSVAGAIPKGSRVRVVGVDGLRIRVTPAEGPESGEESRADAGTWESSPVPGREEEKAK